MILKERDNEGLSQQELSEQLVVGKSNVVGLVDRLERAGYVKRTSHPSDRRYNQIVLAPKGAKLEQRVEQSYFREVDRMMNVLTGAEKKVLIHAMEKIRQFILTSEI
jgi:DNA-binding MarR family transcriptional regulator